MFEDRTWRNLGEILSLFRINSEGDVAMLVNGTQVIIGNVRDGRLPSRLMLYAHRSV